MADRTTITITVHFDRGRGHYAPQAVRYVDGPADMGQEECTAIAEALAELLRNRFASGPPDQRDGGSDGT